MYNFILVLKTPGVQCCSSSCAVVKSVFRHYDSNVQACSCIEISEHKQHPKLKFSAKDYCGLKISRLMPIPALISCRRSVLWYWYPAEHAYSGTGI